MNILREPRLLDFVGTIAVSGAFAIVYFFAIRQPDRNALTRSIHRYSAFWSRSPIGVPQRAQMIIVIIVCASIAIGATVMLIVQVVHRRLP